jgi:hypothetical protein
MWTLNIINFFAQTLIYSFCKNANIKKKFVETLIFFFLHNPNFFIKNNLIYIYIYIYTLQDFHGSLTMGGKTD